MVDNVAVTEGAGKTIATDDVGGRQHQLVKPKFGANNTVTDVSVNAGAADAGTQRTTLASDDPAVALLGTIDTDTSNIAGWDETGRAAVNLVASQVGVAANRGDAGANTVRMAIADNDRIHGPSAPVINSYTDAAINSVTGNDQVLVAAPGVNIQIWVYGIFLITNTDDTTVLLEDSTPTTKMGTVEIDDAGGFVLPPSGHFNMPWFKCATNTALRADVAVGSVSGVVVYALVDVS
jgi:hypothetical protein